MKNIAVICGGDSSEYVVSVKSGKNIYENIDRSKFTPWLIRMRGSEWVVLDNEEIIATVNPSDFSFEVNDQKIKPVYAVIMIHGTPGEDGVLQGYFDMIKLPYSSCGVYSSALTFHKFYCDNFLRSLNVPMAKAHYFKRGDQINSDEIIAELGLPMFVKPSAGGSSFGVTKVHNKESIAQAVEHAWKESNDCLIEEFIEGMELAVGVCELNGEVIPFLPTEVIPKGEFFDFDSKYQIGGATEITPARLPIEKIEECKKMSAWIYKTIGCHGIVRVDYILKNDIFYFLEINTVPGMTETSFIPQQLNAMNLNLSDILTQLVDEDLSKR